MKLTLVVNIGTIDNRRLGLKHTLAGETVDVPEKIADELLRKGWALPADGKVDPAKAEPLTSSSQLPAGRGAVRTEDVTKSDKPK